MRGGSSKACLVYSSDLPRLDVHDHDVVDRFDSRQLLKVWDVIVVETSLLGELKLRGRCLVQLEGVATAVDMENYLAQQQKNSRPPDES